MRYAIAAVLVLLAGCAPSAPPQEGPATKALGAYNACLDRRGAEGCATEKARLDAAIAYTNAQTNRMRAAQEREGVTCVRMGNVVTCD